MIENLVSTIIPVFNRAAMLREAVASVLAQTWRPIEIIIVDDGSSDSTVHTAEDLQSQHPEITHVLRQTNSGPGPARQAGVEVAQGEFIQFLDSDDLLLPNKFELQVRGLREDAEADISYGKTYVRVNGVRQQSPSQGSGEKHRDLFPALLNTRLWETSTPLYRSSVLERIGPWSTRRQLEDWEFDSRAGAAGVKLHYCDQFIAEYVNHDEGRLCHLWMTNINALRDRVSAYVAVLSNAKKAGVPRESKEMQQFARSLFWMARSTGRYGLAGEANQLFKLARDLSIKPGWDYRLFGISKNLLGWRISSRITEAFLERRK